MKNKQNVLFYLEDHNFIQLPPSTVSLQATHHSVCVGASDQVNQMNQRSSFK